MGYRGSPFRIPGFKGIDARQSADADPQYLKKALNTVVGRDGVARIRPAAGYIPPADNELVTNVDPGTGVIRNAACNGASYTATGRFCDYITRPAASPPTLPDTGYYHGLFDFEVGDHSHVACNGTTIQAVRKDMEDVGRDTITGPGWADYQGRVEAAVYDTSTPSAEGGFKEILLCNGRSIMQVWRGTGLTEPVSLSGADPAILSEVERASHAMLATVMHYVAPAYPNGVFHAKDPLRPFEFDRSWYFTPIRSGIDSPVTNLAFINNGLYALTRKSIWRMDGDTFAQTREVTGVGIPSPDGWVRLSATAGDPSQQDTSARIYFISHTRRALEFDGQSVRDIGERVQPILDGLFEFQLERMRAIRSDSEGRIIFLWPGFDMASTEGLAYDTITGEWCGQLWYGFLIDWAGRALIQGEERSVIASSCTPAIKMYNSAVFGGWREQTTRMDLWFSGYSLLECEGFRDYEFASELIFAFDFASGSHQPQPVNDAGIAAAAASDNAFYANCFGSGVAIPQENRSPRLDFGSPQVVKRLSKMGCEIAPTGDFDVRTYALPDGHDIPLADHIGTFNAARRGDTEEPVPGAMRYDISPAGAMPSAVLLNQAGVSSKFIGFGSDSLNATFKETRARVINSSSQFEFVTGQPTLTGLNGINIASIETDIVLGKISADRDHEAVP